MAARGWSGRRSCRFFEGVYSRRCLGTESHWATDGARTPPKVAADRKLSPGIPGPRASDPPPQKEGKNDDDGVGLFFGFKHGTPGRDAKTNQARNFKDLKALERHYTFRIGALKGDLVGIRERHFGARGNGPPARQEVRIDWVSMGGRAEKTGLSRFWVFPEGRQPRLAGGEGGSPTENCNSGDTGTADGCILLRTSKSKMETHVDRLLFASGTHGLLQPASLLASALLSGCFSGMTGWHESRHVIPNSPYLSQPEQAGRSL